MMKLIHVIRSAENLEMDSFLHSTHLHYGGKWVPKVAKNNVFFQYIILAGNQSLDFFVEMKSYLEIEYLLYFV